MDKRNQEIRRRPVVESSDRQSAVPGQRLRRGLSARRSLPILFFAFVGIMIARQEIPALDAWWQKTFRPTLWSAQETCLQAAIAASSQPDYVRILQRGELHDTGKGRYLDRITLGVMGETGEEVIMNYSCYLNSDNQLVAINQVTGQ